MIAPGAYPGSPDRPVAVEGYAGLSWLSASEADWLIANLPDSGLFVEIGTASGVTAARVANARPDLALICVDTFVDSDDPAVAEAEPGRLENWKANRRPNMVLWLGDLSTLCRFLPGRPADAVLIDADHSEAAVERDLELATRLLAPGGVIFAHDCDEPAWPGVAVAVERSCRARGYEAIGQHWTLRALRRP